MADIKRFSSGVGVASSEYRRIGTKLSEEDEAIHEGVKAYVQTIAAASKMKSVDKKELSLNGFFSNKSISSYISISPICFASWSLKEIAQLWIILKNLAPFYL